MLCDFFFSCQYIIEVLNICITYAHTSSSTLSDIIYKSEGSSNDDGDRGGTDNNNEGNEEESFEIEEEIEHLGKLIKETKDAIKLNERLPYSQKEKNTHLTNLRNDPHVQDFYEGNTPEVSDLPELRKALEDTKEHKIRELNEAKNNAAYEASNNSLRDQSNNSLRDPSNSSLRDQSNSSLHKSDNTSNKKEDSDNYSDYKLLPGFLETIIEIINRLLG
jgi:hypothetical protein